MSNSLKFGVIGAIILVCAFFFLKDLMFSNDIDENACESPVTAPTQVNAGEVFVIHLKRDTGTICADFGDHGLRGVPGSHSLEIKDRRIEFRFTGKTWLNEVPAYASHIAENPRCLVDSALIEVDEYGVGEIFHNFGSMPNTRVLSWHRDSMLAYAWVHLGTDKNTMRFRLIDKETKKELGPGKVFVKYQFCNLD